MFIDTFEVRSKPLLKSITLMYSIMDHWKKHNKAYYEENKAAVPSVVNEGSINDALSSSHITASISSGSSSRV